jgi:hypothetical protein
MCLVGDERNDAEEAGIGLAAALAGCAEAAAAKHEGNKCAFMDAAAHQHLLNRLRDGRLWSCKAAVERRTAVVAVCGALRSFATADDPKPATSRCVPYPNNTVFKLTGCDMPPCGCRCCLRRALFLSNSRRTSAAHVPVPAMATFYHVKSRAADLAGAYDALLS